MEISFLSSSRTILTCHKCVTLLNFLGAFPRIEKDKTIKQMALASDRVAFTAKKLGLIHHFS